jgi:hypothetical protein
MAANLLIFSGLAPPPLQCTFSEKVSTIRTVCRCRHYFFDQKCVVLSVLDMIRRSSLLAPTHLPLLLPLYLAHKREEKLCYTYIYFLVYNLVRQKWTKLPFVLNDLWSICVAPKDQSSGQKCTVLYWQGRIDLNL